MAVLDHDEQGKLIRKAGIMSIVLVTGEVRAGDTLRVELPLLDTVKYDHSIRLGYTPALH
jgi:MOSC domain-containing protein YiiM